MAQTAEIKLVVTTDSTDLQKTNEELLRTNKITEDQLQRFKQLEAENNKLKLYFNELNQELKEANAEFVKAKKEFGDTSKEAANADAKVKSVTDRIAELKSKLQPVSDGFQNLKTRVREAKEELQKAEDRFGPFSKEANLARQRAGALADQMGDLNRQVRLLNPEDRIKAFTNLGQGVVGAFSVATGAVQAFGAENERVEAIARKLQGALNIIQGIQSIIGLKEAYQDLRVVLGLTTTAQQTLAVANEAEAASAQTATVANRGLAASLGPIILIVGALAAAYYLLADSQDDAAASLDDLNAAYDELKKNQELALAIAKEQGSSEVELLELRKQNNKLYQDTLGNILKVAKEEKDRKGIQSQINDLKREETLLGVQIEGAIKNATQSELERLQKIREEREKNQQSLKAQFDAEFAAQVQAIEKQLELEKLANQLKFSDDLKTKTGRKALREADLSEEIEATKQKIAIAEQFGKDTQELYAKLAILFKQLNENKVKDAEEAAAAELEQVQFFANRTAQLSQALFDFGQALTARELQELDNQLNSKLISEEQYNQKVAALKRQEAVRQKNFAIFDATLSLGQGILNALTTKPAELIPFAVAFASAIGGLNLAKIIATPLPKFKEGSLNIGGGNLDADGGMHAIVHRGEAIIPADRNKSYHPTLEAIYNKQISPAEINSYVLNRLAGKSGIGRDTVVASVDTYGLSRALSKNKSVQIENAQTVGKAIASELARGYNRRQVV